MVLDNEAQRGFLLRMLNVVPVTGVENHPVAVAIFNAIKNATIVQAPADSSPTTAIPNQIK